MTILITGGSGFLGWNAVRYFTGRGYDAVATFHRLPHYLQNNGCRPVELDLADEPAIEQVVARFQPDCILHAAALARPQRDTDPALLHAVNVRGTQLLAQSATRHRIPIIYISTDLVYPADAGRCDEHTPVAPSTAVGYAYSKLMGEEAVRNYAAQWIIFRPALMYGVGPRRSNSFSQFIEKSWEEGEAAPLFIDQFRSFLYAGDLCTAIASAMERQAWNEIFVCGGAERLSRGAFGLRLAAARGLDPAMCRLITTADLEGYVGGPSDIWLDTTKLQSTGWRPRSLEACFAEMDRIRAEVDWSEF